MVQQEGNEKAITKIQENAKKVHKSETSTHSQREEKIERAYEKEREGSPVPIFPPLNFRIMRILVG